MKFLLGGLAALVCAGLVVWAVHIEPSAQAGSFPKLTPTPNKTATARAPKPTPTPVPPALPATTPGVMIAECMGTGPNSVRTFFLWGTSRSGTQWLDLSIYNNGWLPGTFVAAGPFTSETWGFIWPGLLQGTTHYARVNTLTREGWKASGTYSFYTPVCDPAAYRPGPGPDMIALRDNLQRAIAASGFNAAVAITDLRTGESIDVMGDDPRLPGCTINLFALMRTVVDLQAGRYPEPEPGSLIGQTINRSDPITARALMKYYIGNGDVFAGMREVNSFMHSLGMHATLMDHPPAFGNESLFGYANNVITANDANRGLKALWDGNALTPPWRDYLLRKMMLVKPGLNYLIPAGVRGGAKVSHKNGFLYAEGWADNDVGIVWFERNGERFGYAISFFTQNVRYKYADIPLGQRVSSLAFQWFANRYGYP